MNNRNMCLKTLLSLFILCFVFHSGHSQTDDFMEKKKDGNEIYETPSSKYSQKVQTLYTEILSKLYNDRTTLNLNISELNSKKKELLKGDTKNIEALTSIINEVQEKNKELVDIENDIEMLRSSISEDSNEKRAIRIINSINTKRYGVEIVQDNPEKWVGNAKKNTNFDVKLEADCKVEENGVDPSSLKSKIKIANEVLIEYTHPKLEAYYKEESFITADAGVMLLDKTYYLVLDIVIKSRDAVKNYGIIESGAPMKIELLNGESAYLFAVSNFQGKFVPNSNEVKYTALFVINKAEYKLLKKSEINQVGMMWSSGYEKYDVYNIDLVKKQLDCLDKFK